MLLCMEKGTVSAEETEPRLRELMDDRREPWPGVTGSGLSNSEANSRKRRSRPDCIWRAIMGKWLRRSPKDATCFLRGIDAAVAGVAATWLGAARMAGTMGVAS